jgi:phage head maturation protease
MVGSIPIGAIRKLNEDAQGLFVAARLSTNWLVEPVREAIENKSINGMSFRFEVVKQEWHFKGKRVSDPEEIMRLLYGRREEGDEDEVLLRTLREVKVPELGPVVFPAYPDTTASVRSQELAEAIRSDPEMVRRVRAGLAGTLDIQPTEDMREVARIILLGGARSVTPNENPEEILPIVSNTDDEADSIQPDADSEVVEDAPEEAPAEVEPPASEHSDDAGEPPAAGHSEPESETPDGGRSQIPTAATTAPDFDAEERHLARRRMAAKVMQRSAQATTKLERYSHE